MQTTFCLICVIFSNLMVAHTKVARYSNFCVTDTSGYLHYSVQRKVPLQVPQFPEGRLY
jgi:hypothetical protein